MKEMINPVPPVSPTAQPAPAAAAAADAAVAPVAQMADPLELTIARRDDGICVYSLKDPSTGRTVAVIPAEHARSTTTASEYQAGEYVSVSA